MDPYDLESNLGPSEPTANMYTINPNGSYKVNPSPASCITSLNFSPTDDYLVGTSRDRQVLCSAWKDDGTTVFTGGFDKKAKMWALDSGAEPITVVTHDAAVVEIAWMPERKLLVTGGRDNTLKYWDPREANLVDVQQLGPTIRALTVKEDLIVVGAENTEIRVFDLRNLQLGFTSIDSTLNDQTTCLAAFPDEKGFLVGSQTGWCAAHHLHYDGLKFKFKCQPGGVVNSLNFHPRHGTFASTGSDGTSHFWDKDSAQWKGGSLWYDQPITYSSFNRDGCIFAYAVGGVIHESDAAKNNIFLHEMV